MKPAEDIVKLNEMLKEYADSEKIKYIDYYSVLADENGGLPKQHAEDGVHPNLSCYKIMEKIVLESL
jgi:lysophospholipase L1-like esterase